MEVIAVILMLTLFLLYRNCSDYKDWYAEAVSCTDEIMTEFIKAYERYFGDLMVFMVTAMFFALSLFVIDIVHHIWRRCSGDLQKEGKKETSNKNS